MHNPQNYNEDGTIKKGKLQWKISKTCWRDKRKLTTLYRKKAAYTKQSHERQINELMRDANTFILEEMNFKALQKRSRQKTEKTDKTVEIEKKDGTKKEIRKNKRKRRFGLSIQDRAPSGFVAILKQKCRPKSLRPVSMITARTCISRCRSARGGRPSKTNKEKNAEYREISTVHSC